MQNAALRHAGIDARYSLWDVPPEELPEAIAFLRDPTVLGANLTVPHKVAAIALVDEVAASARAAGAVNTVQKRAGRLIGQNTDGEGFERALRRSGYPISQKHVLVLGAGGAARAVVSVLRKYPLASLTVLNRDPARADRLLAQGGIFPFPAHAGPLTEDRARQALREGELVVNATSVGLDGASLPIPADGIRREQLVFDLVYAAAPTPLLAAAERAGARTITGLAMLLFQGAAAFTLWTGRPAPIDVMRAALDSAARVPSG